MKLYRLPILITFILVLIAPVISSAQGTTSGSIDKEELVSIELEEKDLQTRYTRNYKSWLEAKEDKDFMLLVDAVRKKCESLDAEMLSLSGKKYGMAWSGIPEFHCHGALTSEQFNPITLKYDQTRTPDKTIENYLIGLKQGTIKEPLDAITFKNVEQKRLAAEAEAPEWWERILNFIFIGSFNILAAMLAGIATLALEVLVVVTSYSTGQIQPLVVDRTWVVIRDFLNLVFIIALIAMALGTILRREDYNYKSMLRNLILMAILINFSKVIATTLIELSDTLIAILNPGNGIKSFGKTIFEGFVTGGQGFEGGFLGQNQKFVQGMLGSITKLISLVVLTISIVAIAALMFVRLIGLWFLIMLSPAAYALNILPATRNLAQRWWSEFIKFLIWGPVAMFFFRVAFVLIGDAADSKILPNDLWLNHLFIAAFVYGGYMVAKASGMAGSSAIIGTANSAFGKAKRYATDTAKFSGSAAGNFVWRGGAAKLGYNIATMGRDKERAKKIGEWVGTKTAQVQNIPGNAKQKWITQPNADRQRLVDKERRRTQIRRNYFKLDEENAKKFSAVDTAYLIQQNKWNEENLRALINNGTPDAKKTVMRAFREGHIQLKDGFDQKQYDQLYEETRRAVLKAGGVKESSKHWDTYLKKEDGLILSDRNGAGMNQENQMIIDEIDKFITHRPKTGYVSREKGGDFESRTDKAYYDLKKPKEPPKVNVRRRGQNNA